MQKKLLVTVDMIRGFMKEGSMAAPETQRIVPAVEEIVKAAIDKKIKVVYVRDWHKPNSEEFLAWPKHCIEGSSECLFVPELEVYQRLVTVVPKDQLNAFPEEKFQKLIKNTVYDEIIVTGVLTELCVFQLAVSLITHIKTNGLKTEIIVPKNAVDTFFKRGHGPDLVNAHTFEMMNKLGIKTPDSYKF